MDIIDHLQNTDDNEQERWYIAMALFYENWRDIPAQNRQEAAERMAEFIACGKTQGKPGAKREIDWQQDAELIVGGVNKVAGCEARALPYLHWWTFIAYFMNIGSGPLATVVGIRHKLAKGQKLEKMGTAVLPRKQGNPLTCARSLPKRKKPKSSAFWRF